MENWKDFFTPVSIQDKVIIVPEWDNKMYSHDYVIKLCPAMLGIGHHESTQLIIEQMLHFKIDKCDSLLDLGLEAVFCLFLQNRWA